MLSEKTRKSILELQKQYPEKRSALLPALHLAQAEVGYLPLETQREVADLFGLDLNEVASVVSFYDMFSEQPLGKHVIHVCKNISCLLRGAEGVVKELCKKLNVSPNEVTADGEFIVIPSECLGACNRAPMMLMDEKVVGPIQLGDLNQLLEEAKKGPGHPSPITVEEVEHA